MADDVNRHKAERGTTRRRWWLPVGAGAAGLALAAALGAALALAAGSPGPPPAKACSGPAARRPAAERVVALGDLHGDADALHAALRLAGAVDAQGRWSGGALVVVIVGDVLDRGDQEEALLDALARLGAEAAAAGGALLPLLGNHELMNAYADLRYVTEGGVRDFPPELDFDPADPRWASIPPALRVRAAAFAPGASRARQLAGWNTVQVVGDTVFVHGGVLEEHARAGLDSINCEIRRWLLKQGPLPLALVRSPSAPVWTRAFSMPDEAVDCARLGRVLQQLGVARMVVGHTPQPKGISSACGGKVWRIDVGLARHYGGPIEVLEIGPKGTRRLKAAKRPK